MLKRILCLFGRHNWRFQAITYRNTAKNNELRGFLVLPGTQLECVNCSTTASMTPLDLDGE